MAARREPPLRSSGGNFSGADRLNCGLDRAREVACDGPARTRAVHRSVARGGQEPRVCGNPLAAETRLPPTVDTVAFRGLLDGVLRKLHRPPATTFVDPEGEAVWLHEYVALRVSGASDTRACDRVLTAIRQIIGR